MDRHASDILESEEFLHLSGDALMKLISRNSFCASEMVIFRAVAAWCEFNNVISNSAEPSESPNFRARYNPTRKAYKFSK